MKFVFRKPLKDCGTKFGVNADPVQSKKSHQLFPVQRLAISKNSSQPYE